MPAFARAIVHSAAKNAAIRLCYAARQTTLSGLASVSENSPIMGDEETVNR